MLSAEDWDSPFCVAPDTLSHRIVLAASGEQKQHCHQTSDQSKTGTVHAFTSLVSLALSQRIQLTGCPLMIEATHLELQYTQYRIESV